MAKLIALTQGQFAIVDDDDFEWLNQWRWWAWKTRAGFYARRKVAAGKYKRRVVNMHRLLVNGLESWQLVDHIDRNPLNNQRANLRACTIGQNRANSRLENRNTSGYKGVSWNKRSAKWQAYAKKDGKMIYLGYFSTALEAAFKYDEKARQLFGDFALTNKKLGLIC